MKRKKKEAAAAEQAPVEEAAVAAADEASHEAIGEGGDDAAAQLSSDDLTPAVVQSDADWDGPTRAGASEEIADLAAQSLAADGEPEGSVADEAEGTVETEAAAESDGEGEVEAAAESEGQVADAQLSEDEEEPLPVVDSGRLESIIESLLFAADRALTLSDLKRLLNERDGKKLTAALEALRERHETTGIQLSNLSGGWQFRTHPENGDWVAKLVAGRPQRLSRAMLETLAIVAYRQPITRPEIDEIRGVDCGPVLKTLLDRSFVRILGKKEEVGRPMLYGTTPEFLKTFSLKDLSELPTLREFHELSEQQMADVDAKAPLATSAAPAESGAPSPFAPRPMDLAPVDQQEEDDLLNALDEATSAATRASGPPPAAQMSADAPAPAPEAQET
jgi:segregation and condensation protein B